MLTNARCKQNIKQTVGKQNLQIARKLGILFVFNYKFDRTSCGKFRPERATIIKVLEITHIYRRGSFGLPLPSGSFKISAVKSFERLSWKMHIALNVYLLTWTQLDPTECGTQQLN